MFRTTVYENDAYTVDLDYHFGEVFVHMDVREYNKSVYESMVETWFTIEEALALEGFDRVLATPEKKGAASKLGFEYIQDTPVGDTMRPLYVWPINN